MSTKKMKLKMRSIGRLTYYILSWDPLSSCRWYSSCHGTYNMIHLSDN